jgi:hypothetical protein
MPKSIMTANPNAVADRGSNPKAKYLIITFLSPFGIILIISLPYSDPHITGKATSILRFYERFINLCAEEQCPGSGERTKDHQTVKKSDIFALHSGLVSQFWHADTREEDPDTQTGIELLSGYPPRKKENEPNILSRCIEDECGISNSLIRK